MVGHTSTLDTQVYCHLTSDHRERSGPVSLSRASASCPRAWERLRSASATADEQGVQLSPDSTKNTMILPLGFRGLGYSFYGTFNGPTPQRCPSPLTTLWRFWTKKHQGALVTPIPTIGIDTEQISASNGPVLCRRSGASLEGIKNA